MIPINLLASSIYLSSVVLKLRNFDKIEKLVHEGKEDSKPTKRSSQQHEKIIPRTKKVHQASS